MPDLSEMSQDSSVFPAIPSHLLESTPRIRQRSRRRGRRGKQTQQPSPLGKTPTHTGTSSNSASASSSEQSPSPTLVSSRRPSDPLILLNRRGEDAPANRTRELPPHLPATGELALAETVAIMRNNMRVLEEVQTSLDSGLDELHASLAVTNERVDRLLEEVLVGQQQMMDLVVRIMERVMRIDRNIPVPQ